MTGSDVVSIISQVMQSLQRQVNQPHPDHQEKLSGNLSNLYKKLEGSPVDDFSLLWRNAMEKLGVADKFGSRLEKKISSRGRLRHARMKTGNSRQCHPRARRGAGTRVGKPSYLLKKGSFFGSSVIDHILA
uniref:Uncharacterized protein n=1 Tax=Candidatus Kentrum sp. SD TaxID=2126332 RepID=A0A451BNA5_9GAMM|nr:MAG: hypothetical protein BECKSD772D_GA0070982_10662 [Candidatus Kentron sp. SD]